MCRDFTQSTIQCCAGRGAGGRIRECLRGRLYSLSTDLDSQSNAGDFDVFVMKFDSDGAHQWTILRGGSGDDFAYGLQARCATPPIRRCP